MSQNTSSAVMQQRAPRDIEGDDDLRKLYRALDFFPTPPWAARACAELILTLDPEAQSFNDPACGQGHFIEPLREYFPGVSGSDIHDYGRGYPVGDFFLTAPPMADWVGGNPPFGKAAEFITRALEFARTGVLVLCRIALLEGAGRFELMYGGGEPADRLRAVHRARAHAAGKLGSRTALRVGLCRLCVSQGRRAASDHADTARHPRPAVETDRRRPLRCGVTHSAVPRRKSWLTC